MGVPVAKLMIYRSNLEAARDRASLTDDEARHIDQLLHGQSGTVPVDVDHLPMAFARSLLEDPKLKPNQRAAIALHVHGMRADSVDHEKLYDVRVGTAVEFGSAFTTLDRRHPNAELSWNGRWYPVIVQVDLREDESKLVKHVLARVTLGMGASTYDIHRPLDPLIFQGDDGPRELTVLQVLEHLGFRRLQTSASEYNVRLVNAERLAADAGTQVWVKSAVLEFGRSFWRSDLSELPLGTPEMPRRAIVEPTLEVEQRDSFHYGGVQKIFGESVSRMPFVRVFSLDNKSYVFADIDDVSPYEYDDTALSRLHLPQHMTSILHRVFETPTTELFGDLIRGKHGGVVILASGNPGVGKTLTAEVYAEMSARPLYVLEFGEMGTTVEQIENNLQRIFARVVQWRAVLQFDECEIFLAQRGEDLERSAIVGIFLRMLDYYEGLLFLTTNRPDVLDYAIRSRVMLRLEYPDLDIPARARIWQTMFDSAGMKLDGGTFEQLADKSVNGRQIRNLVRLARILHPDRTVTLPRMLELFHYGSQ